SFPIIIVLFSLLSQLHGVNTSCPLELSPPRVVVKYGDPVTISCMTWKRDHDGMGWEAPQGGKSISNVTSSNWTVDSLTEWDMSPICFFASHYKGCTITPGLVLYKTISIRSSGDLKEGEETVFTCDIVDVAPLQNLSVTWFKGDTIIHRETFNDSTKEPVSQSSILQFTPTREDSGSTITCEARLDLGPVGPDLKVSSEEYAVTVFYPPSQIVELEDSEIEVGSDVWLKCSSVGNPRPKYSWTYYRTGNVEEESEDGVSRLIISNATAYNGGSYTCRASNVKGSVYKTVVVTVNGKQQETRSVFIKICLLREIQ
uniref:Ig-like domain-containing protein n=1 Tax=Salarias fasciatus TaxID=181472 RepID=A0A672IY14_SALFA